MLATGLGVVVVMPLANVRRTLHLPSKPARVAATDDARIVAASLRSDGHDVVAIWRDPVPENPAELAGYIAHITNGQFDPGSDDLRWDAP